MYPTQPRYLHQGRLTQLWQLLREGRRHARYPAGVRENFEEASHSGGCVQPELGSAPIAWHSYAAQVEEARHEGHLEPFLVDCQQAFAGERSRIGSHWLLASLGLQIYLHVVAVTP